MADMVNKIGYAMSLRDPQKEALSYLAAISENCDYKNQSKSEIEAIATAHCEGGQTIKVAKEFDFPSFCFDMATGIGKTRLMGAAIYYLYKTKGYRHFFILAPGNTIYDKLRKEAHPSHPKYIFKGLEAEMGVPRVFDGENYTQYRQQQIEIEKTSKIQLFIFNISKIFTRGDVQFKFHKFQEMLGASFADILAGFDDLVICMDEAHRYYAPQSMKAINYLKPVLGLEFTVVLDYLLFEFGNNQVDIIVHIITRNLATDKASSKSNRYFHRFDVFGFFENDFHRCFVFEKLVKFVDFATDDVFKFVARIVVLT